MEGLVAYESSSGSDVEADLRSEAERPGAKRQRQDDRAAAGASTSSGPARPSLLPPAAALLDGSYSPPPAHQQRQLEQAVLHQGRARVFPHVTGNYATHVFIKVATPPGCLAALEALLQLLRSRLAALQPVVHGASSAAAAPAVPQAATGSGLAQREYHVSLSRTVPLRLHQIEPLVAELRQRLRQQDVFCISIAQPAVFANDDRSRTFLSLAAVGAGSTQAGGAASSPSSSSDGDGEGSDGGAWAGRATQQPEYSPQLVSLCHAVSRVFAAHGLPRFYQDPQPHASVAWLLGDQRQQLEAALAAPDAQAAAARLATQPWQLWPAAVMCKAGQREYAVWPDST